MGAKIDVPTLDGMTTVTIPPSTPSGRKLRLRGRGVRPADKRRKRGDQYILIRIVPPEKLTARQRKLLGEFRQLQENRPGPREEAPWKK